MPLGVEIHLARPFGLRAAPARAFALLRDVPAWGRLFPHVEHVVPLADQPDAFVWTLAPLGPPGLAVQTVYACRYASDPAAGALSWSPVDGIGNARFAGRVALTPGRDGSTHGHLRLDAVLQLPAPAFARPVVEGAVRLAFRQMTETFLERLDQTLGPDLETGSPDRQP